MIQEFHRKLCPAYIDLHSGVDTTVVSNVDRWTNEQMNGRKTGSLYHTMPKAGATIKAHNIINRSSRKNITVSDMPWNSMSQLSSVHCHKINYCINPIKCPRGIAFY